MKLVSSNFPRKTKIAIIVTLALITTCVVGFAVYKKVVVPPEIIQKPSVNDSFIGPLPLDFDSEKTGDTYTILVAGRDEAGYNTDTIMVASFDTLNYTIDVVSIPRDTMSANVTRTTKKINAAYGVGNRENPEQLVKEVENIMGFNVDRYMVIDLEVLVQSIDILGGVEIDVSHKMTYYDPSQSLDIDIQPGLQVLNGYEAMGFVRYRSNYSEGDLRRIQNQQQFIDALADAVLKPSVVTKLPSLISTIFNNIDTDFTIGEIAWMAQEALNVDLENNLNLYTLPGYGANAYGLSYYFVYANSWLELLNESFNPLDRDLTISDLKIQTAPPPGSEDIEVTDEDELILDSEDEFIDDTENESTDDNASSGGTSTGGNTSGNSSSNNGSSDSDDEADVELDEDVNDEQSDDDNDVVEYENDTETDSSDDSSDAETEDAPSVDEGTTEGDTSTEDTESEPTVDELIEEGINPEEIKPDSTNDVPTESIPVEEEDAPLEPWDV